MSPLTVAAAGTDVACEPASSPLHRHDYWYRLRFAGHGRRLLRVRGLDRAAEAWINGRLVIGPGHAPDICDAEVELAGANTLDLCFRAPRAVLHAGRAAAGWRFAAAAAATQAASAQTTSTQTIGYAAPAQPLHAVGPYQPVELLALAPRHEASGPDAAIATSIDTALTDGAGMLKLTVRLREHGTFEVHGGDRITAGQLSMVSPGTLTGIVRVDSPMLWCPTGFVYQACDALGMLVWRAAASASLPALAAVPCARTLAEAGPAATPLDPRWKAGIPRQRGDAWDAEELRDRSLRTRYRVDPPTLRRDAPQRYLLLSRALVADLVADAVSAHRTAWMVSTGAEAPTRACTPCCAAARATGRSTSRPPASLTASISRIARGMRCRTGSTWRQAPPGVSVFCTRSQQTLALGSRPPATLRR
ncbi:hypothetical protein [Cupriavidus necator]|uniref:hypothetical protein n=1 Tax=Cupriavidus necator TaxID=106590 RepID=UPI00339D678D